MERVEGFLCPKNEEIKVRYCDEDRNLRFVITRHTLKGVCLLYEIGKDGPKKLGESRDPHKLEIKFDVNKKISRLP